MAGHALIDVMAELSLCIQYEVLGCFRERTYMLTMNPHITNWVPIAVPQPGEKWVSDGSTYPLRDAVENLEALLAVVMLTPRSSLQLVCYIYSREKASKAGSYPNMLAVVAKCIIAAQKVPHDFQVCSLRSRCRFAQDRLDKWIIWPPPFEACLNYGSAAGESRLDRVCKWSPWQPLFVLKGLCCVRRLWQCLFVTAGLSAGRIGAMYGSLRDLLQIL